MTKNSAFKLALAACLLGVGSLASAADTLNGNHLHAVGAAPAFPAFPPSQNPATRMFDNGVAPDAVADDNIWTTRVTGITPLAAFPDWKMGGWDGASSATDWAVSTPGGTDNCKYDADNTEITFFYADPNYTPADDFLPANNYVWSDSVDFTTRLAAMTNIYLCGNFQAELGGAGDWDDTNVSLALTDDGSDPNDTAGDGIYTITIPNFSVAGGKLFKVLTDGGFTGDLIFGANGYTGANIAFALTGNDIGGEVIIELRASDAKHRITVNAPPPPAGWFATGPWSNVLGPLTEVTPYADGYEGTFVVPTPGYYRVQFVDSDGSGTLVTYPAGADNGYPFITTTPNQQVRVNLHTSVLADTGYQPDQNIVFSDPDSRLDFGVSGARLQFIGFLAIYGNALTSGGTNDWDSAAVDAEGTETSAGSEIFTLTPPVLTGFGSGNRELKGIWNHPDADPAITDVWQAQFGGLGSDRSGGIHNGGNSNATAPSLAYADGDAWTFVVDAATGRTGRVPAASVVAPLRPSRVNTPVGTNVQGWEMFE